MKRLILIGVLILSLTMLAVPAFATPAQNLGGLANFYPEDTFLYFGFRTDTNFLDEIEALAARFTAVSGGDIGEFRAGLDSIAQEASENDEATFANTIQPLLGETGAFGIIDAAPMFDEDSSNDSDSGYLIAFSVTDRAALQSLFTNNETFAINYEAIEDSGDYAIFVPSADNHNREPAYLYFGNSVLLIATDMALFPQAELSARLSDNADFTDTLNMLPAGDYAAAGFLNINSLLASFSGAMEGDFNSNEMMAQMMALYQEAYNGVGLGFTVLDQDHLIMDMAVNADMQAISESMGMPVPNFSEVDLGFASRISADAALAFFYPNLAAAIEQGIGQFDAAMAMQQQMLAEMGADPDELEDIEGQLAMLQFGIQAVTGGTLEESFGWATGQMALAAGIDFSAFPNGLNSTPTRNPINLIFVAENVDGGAQRLYDGLSTFLEGAASSSSDLVITSKELVNGEGINISIVMDDTPFPFEVQIVITDQIFAVGTPDYVEAALAGDGGLGASVAFQNATGVMLGETPFYGYLSIASTANVLGVVAGRAASVEVLSLFESASMSAHIEMPNNTTARYVISLVPGE